ncbi:MAG TPA: STAS domain-containing protein [Beijerinckiaceae bacterium]|jgi:chemotaxis protein CheX
MTKTTDGAGGAFALPAALDSRFAATLRDELLARRGGALTLDATQVGVLGAQCAQILLAAARTWREDGFALALAGASQQMMEDLELLGLSGRDLTAGEALQ